MEITENRQNIIQAFYNNKIDVICGYPGIGKSYLTRVNSRFEDCFFSENYYFDKQKLIEHPLFPGNYIESIFNAFDNGKIVVCAMNPKAREIFDFLNKKYFVIYPSLEEKERYFDVYDNRDDVREWIGMNKIVWDEKIDMLQNLVVPNGCYKDEIPIGMTLTKYLTELKIINQYETEKIYSMVP